jgi:hypothetical protein
MKTELKGPPFLLGIKCAFKFNLIKCKRLQIFFKNLTWLFYIRLIYNVFSRPNRGQDFWNQDTIPENSLQDKFEIVYSTKELILID